jgi:hypothetical protein
MSQWHANNTLYCIQSVQRPEPVACKQFLVLHTIRKVTCANGVQTIPCTAKTFRTATWASGVQTKPCMHTVRTATCQWRANNSLNCKQSVQRPEPVACKQFLVLHIIRTATCANGVQTIPCTVKTSRTVTWTSGVQTKPCTANSPYSDLSQRRTNNSLYSTRSVQQSE